MGTSMSFYWIKNNWLDQSEWEKKLNLPNNKKQNNAASMLLQCMTPEQLAEATAAAAEARAHFNHIFGIQERTRPEGACLAYKKTAVWLPYFEEAICEGYNSSSDDAKKLSKKFSAPVLTMAIFDSDVLFVSYADEKGRGHDYAKPNFAGYEDYDTEQFQELFPAFLLPFCKPEDHEKLRAVWDEPEEIFADDRMCKLCELIGAQPLYETSEVPEGYTMLTVKS